MYRDTAVGADMSMGASLSAEKNASAGDNLSRDERAALERFLQVLETLRDLKPNMPLHMAAAFVRVSLREGASVADLTRDAGVAQSVMSRHLLDIGPQNRDREPGLGLIEHKLSPGNLRVHEVVLTRKGISYARRIARLLLGQRNAV